MAWLWKQAHACAGRSKGKEARQEVLGYPRGGWQPLLEACAAEIEARGGRVLIDRPAAENRARGRRVPRCTGRAPDSFRRGHDPRRFEVAGAERLRRRDRDGPERHLRSVCSTSGLASEVGAGYLEQAAARSSTTRRSACCSSSTASSRPSTGPTSPIRTCPSSA